METARLGRAARRIARRLPPPAHHALRSVYFGIRAPRPAAQREIVFPEDVRDAAAVRDLLVDTDLFADVPEQRDNYLADALDRFRITLALLPELGAGARVLELGAAPYFITRLLHRRGIRPTLVNYWGDDADESSRGPAVLRSPRRGTVETVAFDYFNVERDRFPYADGAFDLVLCCEMLEHMPHDPTHMLAEIHRVLAPERGQLLLTTPNAARWELLWEAHTGGNVYESLSGYGVHGRHNREYTVNELRSLLDACGYRADVFAMDIHPHEVPRELLSPGVALVDRGCNLFALATARGRARWAYPEWLYSSRHAFRRVVRPDLEVGLNHDVQAWGFGELLSDAGGESLVLTPGSPATVLLEAEEAGDRITVTGVVRGAHGVPLTCRVGDREQTRDAGPVRGPFALEFDLPHAGRFTAELTGGGPGVAISAVRPGGAARTTPPGRARAAARS